jgi:hypothetical protein
LPLFAGERRSRRSRGRKLVLIKAVGLSVAVAVGAAGSAAADYPERDTTAVVVWAAGGGTDSLGIERP